MSCASCGLYGGAMGYYLWIFRDLDFNVFLGVRDRFWEVGVEILFL